MEGDSLVPHSPSPILLCWSRSPAAGECRVGTPSPLVRRQESPLPDQLGLISKLAGSTSDWPETWSCTCSMIRYKPGRRSLSSTS